MKKNILKLIIILMFLVVIVPYLFVEGNTLMFGNDFKDEYKQTNMISSIQYYKVFYVIDNKAKVYYVEKNHESGHYLWFEKENSKWKMTHWTTVWSEYGSASGITFPFYR